MREQQHRSIDRLDHGAQGADELPRRCPDILVAGEQVVQGIEGHQPGFELADTLANLPIEGLPSAPAGPFERHHDVVLADAWDPLDVAEVRELAAVVLIDGRLPDMELVPVVFAEDADGAAGLGRKPEPGLADRGAGQELLR